ncbi:MAG: gluconate 2-dehydrogenase subunit 3 family protein [Proteobacteria bacterium]|nr:gluconate 2-dehydrogenase subunit 3 family protein [Pseudomonadota bacterium]MCP4921647.1 gluconate 2-dehydrogenase subunit 3 family protein [Pseudomonadota bacterium]
MQRRSFLKLGAITASGALLLGAVPALGTDERRTVEALAATLFAGVPLGDIDLWASFQTTLQPLPLAVRLQVRGLLRGLEWEPVVRYGGRFSRLEPEDRIAFLDALSTSDLYPRRLMAHGIKQVLAMSVYQHDATWKILGYDGPLVGR